MSFKRSVTHRCLDSDADKDASITIPSDVFWKCIVGIHQGTACARACKSIFRKPYFLCRGPLIIYHLKIGRCRNGRRRKNRFVKMSEDKKEIFKIVICRI